MRTWTADEVAALPVVVDVVTAGEVLGLGRSVSYELARRGEFPVPVLRVGSRYRVVTSQLRALLWLSPADAARPGEALSPASPLRPVSGL